MTRKNWICAQLGAREHYAVPRALYANNSLSLFLTDSWVRNQSFLSSLRPFRRLADRFHVELSDAPVKSATLHSLILELSLRRTSHPSSWESILARNQWFQAWLSKILYRLQDPDHCFFSYSYTALSCLRICRNNGWPSVLGQIDPGYEEERLVIKEHLRYPSIASNWRPAPPAYWEDWHQELRYTDHIIVNSQWSHDALVRQGVPPSKLHTIPLVYTSCQQPSGFLTSNYRLSRSFQLLFIGTICLRKGIARLLEAMDILSNYDIFLTLVGPSEIDSLSWSHLSNVRWIGSVPRSTVASLYRSAHAMILPTISDGFALTQLESLAYGCPVIASTHCGAVIRDGINGWILPSIEPVEIAQTILRARATIDSLCYPLSAPSSDLVSLSNALANLP